ncbi:hypothetical protein BD413DRAFT_140282 [Trametes elegans]|nr:hypothetical protein BD413DRAFT_140282 [Trametes elegans]
MAPSVYAHLITRDDFPTDEDHSMSGTIIAGIVVAAAIAVGAAIWLTIRWFRKSATEKREQRRGSAFVNYTGAADEKGSPTSAGSTLAVNGTFSRDQINSAVIMPEKAVLRPGASRDEILEHYAAEGKLPKPFAPFAGRLSSDSGVSSDGFKHDSGRPSSTVSWLPPGLLAGNRDSRASFMSTSSSISGTASQKKVRQIFDPVLPDELVISLGESLTVVQNFDDGWCIVGRDSMLKPGDVEMGAVPAWIFLKAVKGLRAERPMRVSSLGVTINLDGPPSIGPRDNVMSWSNF